jgi:hypothetical protein
MKRSAWQVTEHHNVFVSYSRNDFAAAVNLRAQLKQHGLSVSKTTKAFARAIFGSTDCRTRSIAAAAL